jgi:hypothetical protein
VLHLAEAQALNLMSLTGEVHIPTAVDIELGHLQATWSRQEPAWVMVDTVIAPHNTDAEAWQQAGLLDIGEAYAIAVLMTTKHDLPEVVRAADVWTVLGMHNHQ